MCRSVSAANLASYRTEGRVSGRFLLGSGSLETFRAVLITWS